MLLRLCTIEMADRVESVIREKIVYLAGRPGGGHLAEGFNG
jgi:hypothetical protein